MCCTIVGDQPPLKIERRKKETKQRKKNQNNRNIYNSLDA